MFAQRTTAVCVAMFSLTVVWETLAGEPVEDLLAATVRIAQRDHSGTGFFVSATTVHPSNPREAILVTAAHVMEQMTEPECELILRKGNANQGYSRNVVTIPLRSGDKSRWIRHPDVDVAIILVELPEDIAVTPISIDQIARETHLNDRKIRVGLETWISCFPAKLEANEAGWPVLRRGSIASHPLIPSRSAKTMLVDYNVFGGDSGAPIAVILDGQLLVVGIASSMQRQTDKSSLPFEERTMHTPLGLSIAVQAAFLHETIELIREK